MFVRLICGRLARRSHPQSDRRGIATVEFAVCLPLIFAMVFGVIETANVVYLQNALTSAAYEASNVASVAGGTASDAQTRAGQVLTALKANGATVTISPAVTSSTTLGTEITVTCSAPLSANSKLFGFVGSPTLTARVVSQRL